MHTTESNNSATRDAGKIKVPNLELCRSDLGDGGWSLHAPAGDIVPESKVLASGEGRMVRGEWAPPSKKDYAKAVAEYRRLLSK